MTIIVEKESQIKTSETSIETKNQTESKKEKRNSFWWYIGDGDLALVARPVLFLGGSNDTENN